jgi:uncharacterized membrane protein YbhN (UPF0104 family)
MVIDLSNPFWLIVGILAAAIVLVGLSFYIKSILVDAQVEAARRIRAEEEANKPKPNIGRRI